MSNRPYEWKESGEEISLKRADSLILRMDTPKGRGVFACKDIPARTILEVCPVLVLDPIENEDYIRKTELYNYTYNWPYTPPQTKFEPPAQPPPATTQAIIFGLGSMFNHSTFHQNVGWKRDVKNHLMTYITLRDIKAGEELCISYGSRLTFKDTDEEQTENDPDDEPDFLNMLELME